MRANDRAMLEREYSTSERLEARRQNVVELLRGLQDRFEQVILITHIEQVREGLDRVISVRYDEETGTSVVTQLDAGGDTGDLLAAVGAAG